jgi:hypothetical protein
MLPANARFSSMAGLWIVERISIGPCPTPILLTVTTDSYTQTVVAASNYKYAFH